MMNDITDALSAPNPLLEIDTSFTTYLAARTRSFKSHVVGGKIDYAFDADFSVRQKFAGLAGWNKIYKHVVTNEIPEKYKQVIKTAVEAGPLNFPQVYDAVKICAERLQISVPKIYVNKSDKIEAYSLAGESTPSIIVLTTALCEKCTSDELRFIIGCECGHIQNNHCIYYSAAPFFGIIIKEDIVSTESARNMQLTNALLEWMGLSDVTADRAGMICCDKPSDYFNIIKGLRGKNITDVYSRMNIVFDAERTLKMFDTLHITPARSISLDSSWNMLERRVFAGMEFKSCEVLYSWRPDIEKSDIHTVNKQALEIRCEIILGADSSKGGAF